jgi:hypothetical protein
LGVLLEVLVFLLLCLGMGILLFSDQRQVPPRARRERPQGRLVEEQRERPGWRDQEGRDLERLGTPRAIGGTPSDRDELAAGRVCGSFATGDHAASRVQGPYRFSSSL